MTAAWGVQLPPVEKLVLLALADWSNDEGACWPSIAKLASKTNASDRTIQRAIGALCAGGHLTRREIPGKGCFYSVHPRHSVTPEDLSPVTPVTPTPDTVSPNTSVTTTSSEAKAPSENVRPASFDQFWEAYPHKVGKLKARSAFDTRRKASGEKRLPPAADLMAAVRSYAAKDDDRPWCNPATWLNQGRWLDEAPTPNGHSPPTDPAHVEALTADFKARQLAYLESLDAAAQ